MPQDSNVVSGQSPPRRLELLDGLRFVAAAIVVVYHYTARLKQQAQDFPELSDFTLYGALGVHTFFMVSGYVILMTAWKRDLPKFVSSRIGRLFPAFWVSVLITGAIAFLLRPESMGPIWEMGWKDAALNLTMTNEAYDVAHIDGVYWTLWVELKFYLLMGLLIVAGLTLQRVLAFIFLWPIIAQLAASADSGLLTELLFPEYAPLFCIGMSVFLIHHRVGLVAWLALGFNLLIVGHLSNSEYAGSLGGGTGIEANSTIVFAIIAAGALLIFLAGKISVGPRAGRWLTLMGLLTYPLYLLHEKLGWWIIAVSKHTLNLSPEAAVILTIVVILAAATAVHFFIERRYGNRLRNRVDSEIRALANKE